MARITKHSKRRMIERIDGVEYVSDAKNLAKKARINGKTVNDFQRYPRFFSYLQNKSSQTATCSLRVYKNHIFIWRGKAQSLVTAHPIPERYMKEMSEIDARTRV